LPHRRAALAALGVVLAVLAGWLGAQPAGAAARARAAGTCPKPPGYTSQRVKVPLDRTGRDKGSVSLCVQRKPASGRRTSALFFLAGGPGQSATVALTDQASTRANLTGLLGPALRTRDLVVYDQRGTGRSGNLRCFDDLGDEDPVAKCAAQLGKARSHFTTPDSVEDIEAVRRKLGVDKIALIAVSYGTKVAEAYALKYPQRVERLILDSILVPEGPDAFSRDETVAIPRVLAGACGTGCAAFSADPAADLHELVTRMATKPLRGSVTGAYGDRERGSISRSELLGLIVAGDFDPFIRADLPAAVRSALDGDSVPLLRLAGEPPDSLGSEGEAPPSDTPEFSDALFLATTCEETELPWPRTTTSAATRRRDAKAYANGRPESDFYPFDRATGLASEPIADCDAWPQAPAAPVYGPGPSPDVPALLVGGEDDVRTSIEQLRTMATRLPGARSLTVAATGHSVLFRRPARPQIGCARRALRAFFADRPVPARCDGPRPFGVQSPTPRTLAAVTPPLGTDPAAGRSLVAAALAISDAIRQSRRFDLFGDDLSSARITEGGLRSGRAIVVIRAAKGGEVAVESLELRSNAAVEKVTVTGTLKVRSGDLRGTVSVGGPERGRLTLAGGTLSGTLGGTRVSAPFAPPLAAAAATPGEAPTSAQPGAR
jgi:pimeloyl-ACP methyl ester carboxylesterase